MIFKRYGIWKICKVKYLKSTIFTLYFSVITSDKTIKTDKTIKSTDSEDRQIKTAI